MPGEPVVLEHGSELTAQLGGRLLAVQVRDLDADPARGTIRMDLAGIDPGRELRPAPGGAGRTTPEITPGRFLGPAPLIEVRGLSSVWHRERVSNEGPRRSATPPAAVRELATGRQVCLAWGNQDALTFEVANGPDRCFVKWAPAGSPLDLVAEAARMTWAVAYTPVPRVLGLGADGDGSWLITAALPGHNAVLPRWLADPRTAVTAIGEGLRAMQDALPVTECPFSWMAQDRIAAAQRAVAAGRLNTSDWAPEHRELGIEGAITRVRNVPPDDQLVVCHGDACAPNTLIADDGRWTAHVDLGDLGVADRWADLAIATWSTEWNYGPRLGAGAAGRLRDQAGRRAHQLLPAALGPRLEASCPVRGRAGRGGSHALDHLAQDPCPRSAPKLLGHGHRRKRRAGADHRSQMAGRAPGLAVPRHTGGLCAGPERGLVAVNTLSNMDEQSVEWISPRQFHEAAGTEDWRVVGEGACAYFRAGSFEGGARLLQRISELAGLGDHHPDADLRHQGVTVRLITITAGRFGLSQRDVELARQGSPRPRRGDRAATWLVR